jgi:hypothetical protein
MLTNQPRHNLFDSRRGIPHVKIQDGDATGLLEQKPAEDRWYDLNLSGLRRHTRTPVKEINTGATRDLLSAQFPNHQREFIEDQLLVDPSDAGQRFRDSVMQAASGHVVEAMRRFVLNSSTALPTPHVLFDRLLLQGAVRLPSEDVMPLSEVLECRDPQQILEIARYIWRYSGFEGVCGDHGYQDLENPPNMTLARYHGNPSRAGFNVQSRVAWSHEFQQALVTRTPIAMSNMEALADSVAATKGRQIGLMPTLFSAPSDQRIQVARDFGRDILITVRTSQKEIALAKVLLDIGANVHIELANAHSHIGLGALIELKDHVRAKIRSGDYKTPRFVTIGKSVGGAFYIAAVLAGADGVFVNRGSSIICSTPTVSGSGIRTWSAVYETALAQRLTYILSGKDVPFWADAGINSGADILKAMVAGAEGSMVGTALIRTIDSPPAKTLLLLNYSWWRSLAARIGLPVKWQTEWRTESWGDASPKGQRHRTRDGVAPQGVVTTQSIPLGHDGQPVTMKEVVESMVLQIKAGGADAAVESASEIPTSPNANFIRFPDAGAQTELKAKSKAPRGEVVREFPARVGDD